VSETTHDLESSMTESLDAISSQWNAMLTPQLGGGALGGPKSQSARITADDHSDTEVDIDRTTRVVSLRRYATDVLNGWSRVVMEDRPVSQALPDGTSAPSMCAFLSVHAQWMSGQDAAEDCAEELSRLAHRITSLVQPSRKTWMDLGSCPLKFETNEPCGGKVRAYPRSTDADGEVMAKCRTCGTEAVASWWESEMFDDAELKEWLTDAELVTFVHRTFGKVIKEATVRQWVRRGVLVSGKVDDKGRRLFHRTGVVYALDRRAM